MQSLSGTSKRMKAVLIALLGVSLGAAVQLAPEQSLEGLWVAKERYGPDIRGTLRVFERDGSWSADISGFSVPVIAAGRHLSFTLPDGKGSFRGTRNGAEIEGHWIQPMMLESGARFSTPVLLRADGPGRWTGEVLPRNDQMTYYLPVTRSGDGRYATYLRNPERNQGLFLGVSRIEREGETVRLVGARRGRNEETVLATGRYDPEAGSLRLPLYGRTFDFFRDTDTSSPFYARGNPPERYRYSAPVQLADGWPVSSLEKEGIDQAAIERFVQSLIDTRQEGIGTSQVHSLLIARNGRLVLEEYFHGQHRDLPHDTRSASKSWTNVLIGAAMYAGGPIRLSSPVYETMLGQLPEDLDPRKKAMTLEHLLTMTAGFDCNDSGDRPGDEDVYQQQSEEPNWYRYMLNVPLASNNGETIVYCSGKPNLAAGMLERVAGEPLPEMFHRLVAKPLRMGRYHLILQPTGEAYGGGGHHFTTRDFMKLAQLYLNDGSWEGRQIVSREWARTSGSALWLISPRRGQTYGYLWNSVSYDYKGRKLHAYFPGGNGGQVYIAIPDLALLIAFTGGSYADPVLFRPQMEFVPQQILPAVR